MAVSIGGAAGAWGDSSLSTAQLLEDGLCDYLIYEGLAEITMAILTRARAKDPTHGYARDLIETIASHLDRYREQGVKVVTNAGGVNPRAAAAVIRAAGQAAVAVVEGDDLMTNDRVDVPPGAISANAYLGARPIAAALDAGADVVVTGRVVDTALALGPLIHEFGWGQNEFDLLSAGSLAGHLIECGPQASGGLMTDWETTSSWANPGFPIVTVETDGSFEITTPESSDGVVDVRTVAEQLLYEIGDPARYLLPDVTCDWREVKLAQTGTNRVHVSGARGLAPPPTLKACAQIPDGWRAQFLLFIAGREAAAKAERVGRDLIARGERMLAEKGIDGFRNTHFEVLGSEATYGPHARGGHSREVILKIAVHHDSRDAVDVFVREVPSIALSGPPGVSGGGTGLPRPTPLIRLDCFPVDRRSVAATVELDGEVVQLGDVDPGLCAVAEGSGKPNPKELDVDGVEMPLIAVAHGRSGDKGSDVNIGIRARHADLAPLLGQLTSETVAEWLSHLGAERVERYELPGIDAVNFLLVGGLGGGGTASLRFDPQGKAIAQQLLDIPVRVPRDLVDHPAIESV